jgi:FG-GAP-like repeat
MSARDRVVRGAALVACLVAVLGVLGCGAAPSRPQAGCSGDARLSETQSPSGAASTRSASTVAGPAPSFRPRTTYPTGSAPASVAIGDLDGDCSPDLVAADFLPNTVSVLLNKGDGSFQAKRDFRTGLGPDSVVIGDLNADGKQDLVTLSDQASTISVLLNRDTGSFQAKVDYRTGEGPAPGALAIGDLNGDGKPDLATANYVASTVSVFVNKGDGSFRARLDYRTEKSPRSVAIGDLNGDGKQDLATVRFASTVSTLLNRGDGSFEPKRDYRTGDGPRSLVIGDLNGDGKPDLATANYFDGEAGTVSVLLNKGDGSFLARRDYATRSEPLSIARGDLNGDSKPDLATANECGNTFSMLDNRGDGSFEEMFDYRTRSCVESVAIGDLNGDGKGDLVYVDAGGVSVLTNR